MPETVTFSQTPNFLPYFEYHYHSTAADCAVPWFFHEYVSRARTVEQALKSAEVEEGEPSPVPAAISGIVRVISKSRVALNLPEVSVFHGEAIVTWKRDNREVSLVSRGSSDDPKLLRYESGQNEPSQHKICSSATAKNLDEAIAWLHG
jgi:hypothetical protein